jgi:PAS domain S-box-containing protein
LGSTASDSKRRAAVPPPALTPGDVGPALLRALLDDAADLIAACGADGRLVYCNRGWELALGHTRSESLGLALDALVAPESRAAYAAAAQRIELGEAVEPLDVVLVARDGRRVPCRGRATPEMAHGAAGLRRERVRFVFRPLDAEPRPRPTGTAAGGAPDSDAAARERDARNALIYRSTHDMMFLVRVEGGGAFRCESVNEAYVATLGLREDELVGRTVDEIFPEPARSLAVARYEEAIASRAELRYDELVAVPSGQIIVETALTPVFDDAGDCTHLICAARDVTERRRAKAALAESERRYRTLFDEAGDGMLVCDSARMVVADVNARLCALLRLERGQLVGRPVTDFVARDSLPLPGDASGTVAIDRVVRRGDGTEVRVEITAAMIDGGRVQCVLRDVTERRRVEEMRERLVGVASHELRSPLSAVRGALHLLARTLPALDPDAQRLFDLAQRNTERLLRLATDLLDLERLEQGATALDREPHAAAALLEQARETVELLAAAAGVAIRIEAAPVVVHADHDRVVQVVTNLASNAIKFSPRGTTVTLAAAADGGAVRITVADQGRGLPPDQLERVFERFAQVDAADHRELRGAGLGLAICRAIVGQHGGRIWVESAGPGRGSTFSFTLPTP